MDLDFAAANTDILEKLNAFNEEHTAPTAQVKLSAEGQQKLFEKILANILSVDARRECFKSALTTIKILSRNKVVVNSVITSARLDILLSQAGLLGESSASKRDDKQDRNEEVIMEALRCLSNIYFQSSCAQNYGVENATIPSVIEQTKQYADLDLPYEIMTGDVKLLFLITAVRPESRSVVSVHYRGISRLTDVLRLVLTHARSRAAPAAGANCAVEADHDKVALSDSEITLATETLKVLFSLTINSDMNPSCIDEEGKAELIELAKLVTIYLTIETETPAKKDVVISNCVNLLTNYPLTCLEPLRSHPDPEMLRPRIHIEFEGACMNAPSVVLNYLRVILEKVDRNVVSAGVSNDVRERLSPALKALVNLIKSHRLVRRFLRAEILPPLKGEDVVKRPEEGNTMRNKLCRLLTSPANDLSTLTSELLFSLCKEKVGRFVKHTGYGNAAGLLARRGLMMGGRGEADYSSTDEDSDTEDYLQVEHQLNPIMGCLEPTNRANPFAEMSDEQKEYEAVKLANAIDRLHNLGVIRPARVDDTGKPVAVDHVLQLVEEQETALRRRRGEDGRGDESDSD